MRKNISLLFLASILLTVNSSAMEGIPPSDIPPKFDSIRRDYQLPTTISYNIPEKLQTGYLTELHAPEEPFTKLNPESPTFYEELRGTVLTPATLYELLPLEAQQQFFDSIREEGSQIDFQSPYVGSEVRRQSNLLYAKFFLTSLNKAATVIPLSLFRYCPVTLIVDQQFSNRDDHLSLAYKYERLGLSIKDIEEGVSKRNRHYLMSESFGEAGMHFFQAAQTSTDTLNTIDLLISSGICYEWSAIQCLHPQQAGERLKLAQGLFKEGYEFLSQAYKEHRQNVAQGKYTVSEANDIKNKLNAYVTKVVSWSKDFHPQFYEQLRKKI